MMLSPNRIICIDRKMIADNAKPRVMAFIGRMADSTGAVIMSWEEAQHLANPVIVRGLTFHTAIKNMMANGRNFFYIDNGYFGNHYTKMWFRIIENHVHDTRSIMPRSRDRLERCALTTLPRTHGKKILLAPPSIKSFSIWNIYQDQWIAQTVAAIKQHTDRPIVIREKRPRWERFAEDTIEQALADDVHCLVTYNSVAAVEAVMRGVPAMCLGPNAAAVVSSTDLSEIENPRFPDDDLRDAWLRHLSYSQFSFMEMSDGTAWRILQDARC